jgi:Na+/H+ antiporter NhaD/arsenite permease-like protein
MGHVQIFTLITFFVVFGLIIWEKMPRMYPAILGAVVMIMLGVFDMVEAISFVSWETIGFLLGMFLLIDILIEAGFFRWVALVLAKKLNYEPLKILIFFPFLAAGLSAFINSITVMIFLAVVTFELSKLLKFDPVPIVVSEVVLSNIGGAATLVGDPPNVILGTMLGFGFNDFIIHNGPIALLAAVAAVWVSYMMSKKHYVGLRPSAALAGIKEMDPTAQIKDRFLLVAGLVGTAIAVALLISKTVSVSMASLLPAFTILTFGGPRVYKHHFMRRIDAETLVFFIGLFIVIGALEKQHIIQAAADFLGSLFRTPQAFVGSIFWGSAFFSAVVDNVPLAMAMTFVIKQSIASKIVPGAGIMVWATSLGVDLGGNLTPIGASANIVAYSSFEKSGIRIGWGRWLKLAVPSGMAALLVAYLGILLKMKLGFF